NGIEISEETKKLVANVQSVEFSDPELVWVGKVLEDATVGALKEAYGLECEYSAELTDDDIAAINAQQVKAGDWALISLQPFDTEETLTVTMDDGRQFVIRITDVSYQGTQVTDPDGKTVALLNLANNNALQSTAHSTSGRLQAADIQLNGNRVTSLDPLTTWTFTRVPNTTDRYYIQASNGYLNISSNGSVTVSSQPQALTVQQKSNGTIRIKHPDNNYAINNVGNSTANGYGAYSSTWDSNPGEWFTMYEIGDPVIPHVTVHYVLRDGTELTDVEYTGNNPLVVKNADGTFSIPYDWGSGQTSDTSVDLRAQFSLEGYTYANTHLAGKDADGTQLTYDGYVIDSVLTRSGSDLQFKSDSGATSPGWGGNPPQGNLMYGGLTSFSLSGNVNARPAVDGSRISYATSGNKDIYVILDPLPGESAASVSGGSTIDADAPELKKTMDPNDDGTYTLSLKVDAHARNVSETNKANILFIVDTSSSMRAVTTDNRHNRIMDTHDAVLDLGERLLEYNTTHPDAVQVSMITFDGGVKEPLNWTTEKTEFQNVVNDTLVYKYLHTVTDW
ncbi:MAG: VWA domain-containing protein, partial [Firmicutes bacterium]|nr:VWA domain-containing protein [Bacillota bacterium]